MNPYAWLAEKVGKVGASALLALLVILLAVGAYFGVKHFFTSGLETQVKVTGGQLGASRASGTDAVNTIGNVMGNEQATDQITRENGDAISNAQGATVVVDPAVRAAGLQSLCRRASYRNSHPACVQQPAAR